MAVKHLFIKKKKTDFCSKILFSASELFPKPLQLSQKTFYCIFFLIFVRVSLLFIFSVNLKHASQSCSIKVLIIDVIFTESHLEKSLMTISRFTNIKFVCYNRIWAWLDLLDQYFMLFLTILLIEFYSF